MDAFPKKCATAKLRKWLSSASQSLSSVTSLLQSLQSFTRTCVNSRGHYGPPELEVCGKAWFGRDHEVLHVRVSRREPPSDPWRSPSMWRARSGTSWMTLLSLRFSCMSSTFMKAYRRWRPRLVPTVRLPKRPSHSRHNELLLIRVVLLILFNRYAEDATFKRGSFSYLNSSRPADVDNNKITSQT